MSDDTGEARRDRLRQMRSRQTSPQAMPPTPEAQAAAGLGGAGPTPGRRAVAALSPDAGGGAGGGAGRGAGGAAGLLQRLAGGAGGAGGRRLGGGAGAPPARRLVMMLRAYLTQGGQGLSEERVAQFARLLKTRAETPEGRGSALAQRALDHLGQPGSGPMVEGINLDRLRQMLRLGGGGGGGRGGLGGGRGARDGGEPGRAPAPGRATPAAGADVASGAASADLRASLEAVRRPDDPDPSPGSSPGPSPGPSPDEDGAWFTDLLKEL